MFRRLGISAALAGAGIVMIVFAPQHIRAQQQASGAFTSYDTDAQIVAAVFAGVLLVLGGTIVAIIEAADEDFEDDGNDEPVAGGGA